LVGPVGAFSSDWRTGSGPSCCARGCENSGRRGEPGGGGAVRVNSSA
jgi:hypothetical protein